MQNKFGAMTFTPAGVRSQSREAGCYRDLSCLRTVKKVSCVISRHALKVFNECPVCCDRMNGSIPFDAIGKTLLPHVLLCIAGPKADMTEEARASGKLPPDWLQHHAVFRLG